MRTRLRASDCNPASKAPQRGERAGEAGGGAGVAAAERGLEARELGDGASGGAERGLVAGEREARAERALEGAEVPAPRGFERLAAVEAPEQKFAARRALGIFAFVERAGRVTDGADAMLEQLMPQTADQIGERRVQLRARLRARSQRRSAPAANRARSRERRDQEREPRRSAAPRGPIRPARFLGLEDAVELDLAVERRRLRLGARAFGISRHERQILSVELRRARRQPAVAARARERQIERGIHRRDRGPAQERLARARRPRAQKLDAASILDLRRRQPPLRLRPLGAARIELAPRAKRRAEILLAPELFRPPPARLGRRRVARAADAQRRREEPASGGDPAHVSAHPLIYARRARLCPT